MASTERMNELSKLMESEGYCALTEKDSQLKSIREFYNCTDSNSTGPSLQYRKILAKYYQRLIPPQSKILEVGCGDGELLSYFKDCEVTGVDISSRQIKLAQQKIPKGHFVVQSGEYLKLDATFDYIILSETINQSSDVHKLFERLTTVANPRTRLIMNFYNAGWRPLLSLATMLGLKANHPPSNWLSPDDVHNILSLTGWELIKQQKRILIPIELFGLGHWLNRFLAPFIPWFCLTTFQIARLPMKLFTKPPSVSVIVPARNEEGNIQSIIKRMPKLGSYTEVIFVEGHSHDNTWEEIKNIAKQESPQWNIVALQQSKIGKANAVHEAFHIASGDILMILDGDLTVPPEELFKFYEVLANGKAEFCNGVRLVYPMENRAMPFLNLCANKCFGMLFSWALDHPIKDTLCGTKAIFKNDYLRLAKHRSYFGEFDPFGDFDLLFGADHLHLKIADIPIHYRERTYGASNIHRWRHGLLLLRMLIIAVKKLKLG